MSRSWFDVLPCPTINIDVFRIITSISNVQIDYSNMKFASKRCERSVWYNKYGKTGDLHYCAYKVLQNCSIQNWWFNDWCFKRSLSRFWFFAGSSFLLLLAETTKNITLKEHTAQKMKFSIKDFFSR